MAITIQNFDELDPDAVEQKLAFLIARLQEAHPTLDLRRGVLHDLLMYPQALFATQNEANLTVLEDSTSLAKLQEDPSLADADLVDRIAANYLLTRFAGSYAGGEIAIVLSTPRNTAIAAGALFDYGGKRFATEQSYMAHVNPAAATGATDRIISALGDGNYLFTVPVAAQEEGEASRLRKDALVTPASPPEYFVKAYAYEDFTGGESGETIEELLVRLAAGPTAKALSARSHMSAALRSQTDFSRVVADSIIGFGDAEMLRDRHSILPISFGGRVDWYIRTQALPASVSLAKTATLVEKTFDGKGIWQFTIGRDDAPGFYNVSQVIRAADAGVVGSYAITEDIRGIDMSAETGEFVPDVTAAFDGAYSRYQTTVIRFKDTDTDTTELEEGESTGEYAVTVRAMPLLAEIQEFASARENRNCAGDILVRAPIPCDLRVSFTIELRPGQSTPDLGKIRDALAYAVNHYGFTGKLPASYLAGVVHAHLGSGAYTGAIDILGRLSCPGGTSRLLRTTEVLEIPEEPERMTGPRTVAFLLDSADVTISTAVANIPEI